jgi:Raf kinase inhibitor-like YbhB/YbcL family protein
MQSAWVRAGRAAAGAAAALWAAQALAAPTAFDDPRLQAPATLQVSIPGDVPDGTLATNYAADGRNLSPPLTWTPGPAGTAAYVVVMQDADAPDAAALHWLLYHVPGGQTALPRGMKNMAAPTHPLGSGQGANVHGSYGYTGPRLAQGEPAHHYHLQVFALDRSLRLKPGATLQAVERAMAGHVVARGETVAAYAAPAPKTPKSQPSPASPAPANSLSANPGAPG